MQELKCANISYIKYFQIVSLLPIEILNTFPILLWRFFENDNPSLSTFRLHVISEYGTGYVVVLVH